MSLHRRTRSRSIDTGRMRVNALKNIDETLEFGRGFNAEAYETLVDGATDAIHRYNAMLANVDKQRRVLQRLERKLNDANERVFTGIATLFGKDSIEYEMIGGTRKSDIRNTKTVTFEPISNNGEEEDETPEGE